MHWFKADLHIHTVLSPCGGLDMSPVNIIKQAVEKKLDIIAITDHNSLKHCKSAYEIGKKKGIKVLYGAEINTKEEIHCLTFFENIDKAELFQQYIDEQLTIIPNDPDVFGNQFVVDEEENILFEETRLLVASLRRGIGEIADKVYSLNGIFVPAHINRKSNGLFEQLGFLPPELRFDALEVTVKYNFENFLNEHPEIKSHCMIKNSDAHCLDQVGAVTTGFYIESPEFSELKLALGNKKGRKVSSL